MNISSASRAAGRLTLALLALLCLHACRPGRRPAGPDAPGLRPMAYASNLTCLQGRGYTLWTLRDPWDTTAVLHRYLLVPSAAASEAEAPAAPGAPAAGRRDLPADLPPGPTPTVIHTPLQRAGVATSVHCGLLDELGLADRIAGVCEQQYIDVPSVRRGLAQGTIADFGSGMNPNIERIMDVAPDVLLLTPFEHSGGYGRAERLGIPVVECAEYMETSPLARAEWVKFYAALFGAEARADSLFRAVEHDYLHLKAVAAGATGHPRLLTEMLYGGQWFVPAAQSTMGIMFADAGADYVFAGREGRGSVALAFETVLDAAQDADLWLVKFNTARPLTYTQMQRDYPPYARFAAFARRRIYGCDLGRTRFYEQTPFHPERLLRDLVCILHPGLLPGASPVYYRPLEE